MAKKINEVPRQAILSGVPGMTAWDNIRHKKYTGPIPDFTGQLRCSTGESNGTIIIPESQLEAKRLKYPNLKVLGKV